jgi:hypothetical protein
LLTDLTVIVVDLDFGFGAMPGQRLATMIVGSLTSGFLVHV